MRFLLQLYIFLVYHFIAYCHSYDIYIHEADVVEWSRAQDIRLSDWCCSVSMV